MIIYKENSIINPKICKAIIKLNKNNGKMTPYQYDDDPNYNLDDKIEDIEIKLEEIYINIDEIKFSKEEYEIYLYPTTINRYIINLINLQHIKGE